MQLKITVIVPCFNMVDYISQTIESIISQKYGNLELIIIDGGSNDGTLHEIYKYKKYITHFISERDDGQYHAINKGLEIATGDIVSWLNADDTYFPWTLSTVSKIFNKYSDVNWIIGTSAFLNEDGELTQIRKRNGSKPKRYIANGWFNDGLFGYLQQESMFWRKNILNDHGLLNLNYRLASDFELWTRFAIREELVAVDLPLAAFRIRSGSRSNIFKTKYLKEVDDIVRNLKKPSKLRNLLGIISKRINYAQRLLTIKRSKICYFSISSNDWEMKNVYRPISNFYLDSIFYL